jgi:hypothetical protein
MDTSILIRMIHIRIRDDIWKQDARFNATGEAHTDPSTREWERLDNDTKNTRKQSEHKIHNTDKHQY